MSTVKKHVQNLTYFFHSQLHIHMFLALPTAYHSKIIQSSKSKILKRFKEAQSLITDCWVVKKRKLALLWFRVQADKASPPE